MAMALEINSKVYENETPVPSPIRNGETYLDREYHSMKTIHDLPPEVLEELFDYLTYTEKLISRVVCQNWNTQISSTLLKTSYYSLASKESLQVLLDSRDSGMDWKNLRISNLSDAGFILPTKFKNSITALDVHFPNFGSKICDYIRFLTGFPNLTTLKVRIDGGPMDCGAHTDPQLKENTMGIYEKLKNLSITFQFNNYTVLCKFLSGMNTCQSLSLDALSIVEEWPTDAERLEDKFDRDRSFVCLPVFNTIRKTAKTLRSLTLDFSSKTIERLLPNKVLPWLSGKDILKLEDVLIRRGPIRKSITNYFVALQKCLKTQAGKGKLKKVILPWCPSTDRCEEFLKFLPKDIEFVGNVRDEHLTPEFPTQFKNLKSLCIESDLTKDIFNDVQDNVRQLKFDLRNSRTFYWKSPYKNMSDYLHNLTELQVIGNNVLLFDSDLVRIIVTLKDRLRVLQLESWKITDYGVLGVEELDKDLRELIQTKTIYFPQSPDDNLLPKMMNSLSSMTKLEKLVLVGTSITDAGIILGFKFGNRLKELTLGSDSGEITNFGLYSLGSNNPGLEAFQGSFQSKKISTVGIEKLKTQLLLTETTRKFKVVNEKP